MGSEEGEQLGSFSHPIVTLSIKEQDTLMEQSS